MNFKSSLCENLIAKIFHNTIDHVKILPCKNTCYTVFICNVKRMSGCSSVSDAPISMTDRATKPARPSISFSHAPPFPPSSIPLCFLSSSPSASFLRCHTCFSDTLIVKAYPMTVWLSRTMKEPGSSCRTISMASSRVMS